MIPVLYSANTTDFSTFGLGVLTDTIFCEVTEERNGVFECLLKYPVSGQHYGLITKECIIKAKPNDTAADQAFRIYRITKPLNSIVTIYGQHISYDLANVPVMPFSTESRSPQLILSQLLAGDSLFTRKTEFRVFDASDIDESAVQSRTDTGWLAKVYQFSRRRTSFIYFLRDTMWRFGKWKTKALLEWVQAFAPNVIFLAAGDYAFPYRIAIWLSDFLHIPIVMWCADDFYIEPLNHGPFFRRIQCQQLVKLARKVIHRGGTIVTISDMMQRDYARLFQVPTKTIRISSAINHYSLPADFRSGVVYVGNLGINRIVPLTELGRALRAAAITGFETINVYSGERNSTILQQINKGNGLTYCGCISEREVERLLGTSKFIIFTEAFDNKSICRTKYSLSTKIAESLRSGACILAYGPSEIAAIDYLRRYRAAYILEKAEELPNAIRHLCEEANEYSHYTLCAQSLAEQFHSAEVNEECLRDIFVEAISNYKTAEVKECKTTK